MTVGSATTQQSEFVLDLTTCDREPIRTPGAIQPHGVLFALSAPDLIVTAVSANIASHLATDPASLLGHSIAQVMDAASFASVQEAIAAGMESPPALVRLRWNNAPTVVWRASVHLTADGALLEAELPHPNAAIELADLFHRYDQATRRLRSAKDAATACQRLAQEVRRLTGFDRVKIYRFARDWSGEVIAEATSVRLPSYLGLNFPASDVPTQARELYRSNLERLIPDIDYTPVPLIQANTDPLDLSAAALRSVSPIHLEYLHNMQVGASMSVSILRDGQLWGLVACHHAEPLHVPAEIRQASVLLAQLVAWQLAMVEEAAILRLETNIKAIETELLQETTSGHDYRDSLLRHGSRLLELLHASGLALINGTSATTLGATLEASALQDLAEWLAQRGPEVFETDNLASVYPAAANLPAAAGILAVPLGGMPKNVMIWFRPEIARTVNWAGNPEKPAVPGSNRLNPRLSYAAWTVTYAAAPGHGNGMRSPSPTACATW